MSRRFGLWALCIAICLGAGTAQAQKMAIGAFTGINIPIAQDDATEGSLFGVRAQLQPVPLVRFEPRLSFIKNGTVDALSIGVPYTWGGGDITGWGIDAVVGSPMGTPGVGVGLLVGIGSYKREVDNPKSSSTNTGYSGGLDVGMTLGPIRAGARGEFLVITQDPDGSRKNILLTVGVSYAFGAK